MQLQSVIIDVIDWLYWIMFAMFMVRMLLSWMPAFRVGRIAELVFSFTEPFLLPARRLIDRSPLGGPGMMLDFSPLVVLFFLRLLRSFLTNLTFLL